MHPEGFSTSEHGRDVVTPMHSFGDKHHRIQSRIQPVAQVGQRGVHASVVEKIKEELEHHELIKVKVGQDSLDSSKEVGAQLAEACDAFVAQVIGRTILLYRPREKDPEITLP